MPNRPSMVSSQTTQTVLNHSTGNWIIEVARDALVSLRLASSSPRPASATGAAQAHLRAVAEYLEGVHMRYPLPIALKGTPFQLSVWQALQQIPYGTTISYKTLASAIGAPKAFRAVGTACGANPIAVVIPCHRVLASDGGLGGYAYGLPVKQRLLAYEANATYRQRQIA